MLFIVYICQMNYEDQIRNIFKDVAAPLEQLPKILEQVMNNELKNVPEEQAKKIKKAVEALQPELKVKELRDRMDSIMSRVK